MTRSLSPQFGSTEYHQRVLAGGHPPAMFATAREIVDTHNFSDQYRGLHNINNPRMWAHSSKEALLEHKEHNQPELTKNIKEKGYDWSKPVVTYSVGSPENVKNTGVVTDGHHRIAAMLRHRPDEFLPLEPRG
jgi:hypothetical protein